MKITNLDVYEVVVPTRPGRVNSPEFGRVIFDEKPKFVFEAHTDDGIVGIGEGPRGWSEAALHASVACLKDRSIESICFQEPPLIDLSSDDFIGDSSISRPHRLLERSFNNYE